MTVNEVLKNEMLLEVLWGRRIELENGEIYYNLQDYLRTTPEGRAYLLKREKYVLIQKKEAIN